MKAMQQQGPGAPLEWTDAPDPVAGHGEVVVEVVATAVNRADLMQAAGHYPPPLGESDVIGLECSGTIVHVGDGVEGWAVGDEVCALLAGGGYAERVAVPATQLLPVPTGVSLEDAAALPEAVCTVWTAIRDAPAPALDGLALVHGGSGGVGSMAIQVLTARGYRVATTASERHHELVHSLGAEIAIDYRSEDFEAVVHAATDGHGAELILDVVGGEYLARNVAALALDGTLTVIAAQGGTKAEIDLRALMQRRVTLRAMTLRARPHNGRGGKADVIDEVRRELWPLLADGEIAPVIGAKLRLTHANEAHALMGGAEAPGGKILLVR
ncbi:putative PIG3 family NAD(P)H quinone oxidoreductase [Agrococcus sp. UYP33]